MDPVTALLASATAIASSVVAGAVTAATNNTTDVAPYIQGGSAVAAVAALGYIAKQFAAGNLVARNSGEAERALTAIAEQVTKLVEAGHERERLLMELLVTAKQGANP